MEARRDAPRRQRPLLELIVIGRERLSPGMLRLRFRAADAAAFREAFAPSVSTDRYVKLVFERDGGQVVRTYTALEPDLEAATFAIDFVLHGDDGSGADVGVAARWAAGARLDETITVRGPGGGYAPDPTADWHLLAGDEAGLPAIRAALAALPADAQGCAVIEVPDVTHEQPLAAPAGVELRWVHAGTLSHEAMEEAGGHEPALLAAVRAVPWREGRVHAFVHGEAQVVMHGVRPYLLAERGLPRSDVSISGYWRRGRSEESFREWKAQLAAAESGA